MIEAIRRHGADADYPAAYRSVMEEVAYTWFNRLIAIRFMEVNNYLPTRTRVLSSESGKIEPDLVTDPIGSGLPFTAEEERRIYQMKQDNQTDELFRFLFIKQCNALQNILPALFEQTEDYTELLLNLSVVDQTGVVWRLTHDIQEDDFNMDHGGQVAIIGWLYQYYNTELKAQVSARPASRKITKEDIPAVTQLFTPEWIVHYMVENSLGRLWLEGHPDPALRSAWRYYVDEAEQAPDIRARLEEIRKEYRALRLEEIRVIDPCMGSGHILEYAFDLLMRMYEKAGWERGDAVRSIVENNLWGLDVDKRAYQMAYFAVMMKGRQYDPWFLTRGIKPNVYEVQASGLKDEKYPVETRAPFLSREHQDTLSYLLEAFRDAKEYGSLLQLEQRDYSGLLEAWESSAAIENLPMMMWYSDVEEASSSLIRQAAALTQKYHVVVTNPPYLAVSSAGPNLQRHIRDNFPDSKADLFAVFIERCRQMARPAGFQAMITQHAWMFLSSFEKLRAKLQTMDTVSLAHLGSRAFEEIGGEVVQTASFVLRKTHTPGYRATYCRLTAPNTQQGKEAMFLAGENRYVAAQDSFSRVPGAPVAYWASERLLSLYEGTSLIGNTVVTKQGLKSSDDKRFFRYWPEVSFSNIEFGAHDNAQAAESQLKWFPLNKGGNLKWYGENWYVVNWENDGKEIKAYARQLYRSVTRTITSISYYFKRCITWPQITSAPHFRSIGDGFIFNAAGPSMFVPDELYFYLLGLLNTPVVRELTSVLNPTVNLCVTDMLNIPLLISKPDLPYIETLVKSCCDDAKADWDSFETSWDFVRHPLVRPASTLAEACAAWESECGERFARLKASEEAINDIFIRIYGLQNELSPVEEDREVTIRDANLGRDIRSLLSYAVGCMFGRYSLDAEGLAYAGGKWEESRYVTFQPDAGNILPLTDEEYLEDDIVARLCRWLQAVYGPDSLEENLDFIARALGGRGATSRAVIRSYFLKDFFSDHCKTYQKRPIYWLFDSGKQNGFKALVYLHRYTPDTIGKLRVDYLHRLQRVYASEIERMQDMIDNSKNQREVTASTKRKEKLQKQLKECREYDEKIAHLALARIELDLDDGVKVNYRKLQTASDGKLYEVLADSKNIMGKK